MSEHTLMHICSLQDSVDDVSKLNMVVNSLIALVWKLNRIEEEDATRKLYTVSEHVLEIY